MKINGKKWYIIGSLLFTLVLGVILSATLSMGAVDGTKLEDYVTGSGRVRAMSISASAKEEISLNKTAIYPTYNAEPKEYELSGEDSALTGFTIEYKVDGEWTVEAPINYNKAGYLVRITRPEDEDYQAYDSGEFVGLHIQKKPINLVVRDYEITYGSNAPNYAVDVVDTHGEPGLEGNDTIAQIYQNITPYFDCDYTTSANVGNYKIELLNGRTINGKVYAAFNPLNYAVNVAYDGNLKVTPATIEYVAESYYGYYDGGAHGIDVKLKNVDNAHICYSFDGSVYYDEFKLVDYTRGKQQIYFKIIKPNYTTVEDSRFITINPKPITLIIDDTYSKEGEPIRPMYFRLDEDSSLAVGDTLEDLGVTLNKAGGDKAGRYTIYGTHDNVNYIISWVNGEYTITATTLANQNDGSVVLDCLHGLDPDYKLHFEEITEEYSNLNLTNVTGEYTEVLMVYDISVLDKESQVVSVEGKSLLQLRVRLNAEQKNTKNLQVVYVDDYGKAKKVESNISVVGDYLVFTVDHLSTYAIVGDMVPNYMTNVITIMVIADVIMLLCFILLKRKNRHIFYSFSPMMLSMYTPKETTFAIISLAVVTVVLAVMIFVELFKDGDVRNKYDYSFTSKIYLCKKGSIINKFYSKLRNRLYQYKGVTSVITWKGESFYYGDIEIAKLMIDRSYLDLFVAIEYGFFRNSRFKVKNAIRTLPGKTTPSKLNIDTEEDYIEACDIIDMVAEKYNMTKSRKYTNIDYSTRQVSLKTLMSRGLVITDKMLADEYSWEPREVKNIYKATYSRNKNVRHVTYTNDDNSLSMSMVEVVFNTYKYFIARLKACNARCTANYATIKNMLLSYETMINKMDQTHEVFYLANLLVNVTVNEKHIFVHFEGSKEDLLVAFDENEINDTSTILFDLNYDENVAHIMTAVSKIGEKHSLLKMSDYKQKSFKSLILDN